jgi:DNA-binding NarL/FixJ family response regulator
MDGLSKMRPRAQMVAFFISQGCDREEIKERMGISEDSLKKYFSEIFHTVQAKNQIQAMWRIRTLIF